jgi:hypothetical protein
LYVNWYIGLTNLQPRIRELQFGAANRILVYAKRPKKRANSGAVNVVERTGEDKKFKVEIVQKYTRPKLVGTVRRAGGLVGGPTQADPPTAAQSFPSC